MNVALKAAAFIGALSLSSHAFAQAVYCPGIGSDFSANAATIPESTFVLLATIPVACGRNAVEVQNQSAGMIQVVRDDGAGNNQSTILLSPGSAANSQGGGWSSVTFKGRVRVYGVTGAQISAFQE